MASKYISLIGSRFGILTAIGHKPSPHTNEIICRCDCGKTTSVLGFPLSRGEHKSCGCLRKRLGGHGSSKNPLFTIWRGIMRRCCRPEHWTYKGYGARGIKICDGWKDLSRFYASLGDRSSKKHSVDRKDNNGHYSCGECKECISNGWPMNCRWATVRQQSLNRQSSVKITYEGQTKHLYEWAEERGIKPTTLYNRVKVLKWTVHKSLTTPIRTANP